METSKNISNGNEEIKICDTMEKLGKYQLFQYAYVFLGTLLITLTQINYVFVAADLNYRCRIPECDGENTSFNPFWWPNVTINRCTRPVLKHLGKFDETYNNVTCTTDYFSDDIEKCTEWLYESTDSVIEGFNLACQPWMSNMIGTIHSIGILLVTVVAGWMSDRFGRKPVLVFCLIASCIGLIKAYTTSYYIYLFIEFLEALLTGGTYGTASILMMEIAGKKNRMLAGVIFAYSVYLGESVLAIFAMFVPHWKDLIKIIYSPPIIFLSYIYFVKESPRWQIVNGKSENAKETLLRISDVNNVNINKQKLLSLDEEELKKEFNITNYKQKETIKDALRSKEVMKRVLIGAFCRFSACLVYYGLMVNSVYLPGNKYTNFFLSSLMSYPGDLLALYLMNKIGRKTPLIYGFIFCGLLCIGSGCVPEDFTWIKITLFLIGKMIVSGCFIGVVTYAIEMIPTSVRGTLLGFSALAATTGNVLAPLTPILATVSIILPSLIFGALSIASGLLLTLTPETKDAPLAETIERVEYEIKSQKIKRKTHDINGRDNNGFNNDNEV